MHHEAPAIWQGLQYVEKPSKDTAEQPEDSKGNHSLWQGVQGGQSPPYRVMFQIPTKISRKMYFAFSLSFSFLCDA